MSAVRRKDYEQGDRAAMLEFLDAATHGFLAFVRPDGSPGLVALNFARVEETLYFHGSPEGEKMTAFAREPRVTFMVADDFSLVPSYFRDPQLACPATQYYRAVVVHGSVRVVREVAEKAAGLQALMEKLQPEGGYQRITAADPLYTKTLATTAVLALPLTEMTAKFKFGQNLPARKRKQIADRLLARDQGRDAETVAAMRAVCPF
jgi:nitroimidazol reductase NimA-like FMN-containing flavoprotein (pyridoxamine 5'-phosphate oxidase superfamily)